MNPPRTGVRRSRVPARRAGLGAVRRPPAAARRGYPVRPPRRIRRRSSPDAEPGLRAAAAEPAVRHAPMGPPMGIPTPNRTFAPVAGASPFGNVRASTPAVPIPAPSGIPAASTGRSFLFLFNKVQLPIGGLIAVLLAAVGGGLFAGALFWYRATPEPAATTTLAAPAPAATAPAAAAAHRRPGDPAGQARSAGASPSPGCRGGQGSSGARAGRRRRAAGAGRRRGGANRAAARSPRAADEARGASRRCRPRCSCPRQGGSSAQGRGQGRGRPRRGQGLGRPLLAVAARLSSGQAGTRVRRRQRLRAPTL